MVKVAMKTAIALPDPVFEEIARETGLGRESLYKALSIEGNPEFATVLKVIQSLGLRLQVVPIA